MTTTIEIYCGCNVRFKGEKVEHFPIGPGKVTQIKSNTLDQAIREAQSHAYETGHTLDGFIRISLDSDDPAINRKSRKGQLIELGSLLGKAS